MIKSKSDLNLLCSKPAWDMTNTEYRLLIFNYIYYKKGIERHDVFTAKVNDGEQFTIMIDIAHNYFKNI